MSYCPFCKKSFKYPSTLLKHFKVYHIEFYMEHFFTEDSESTINKIDNIIIS